MKQRHKIQDSVSSSVVGSENVVRRNLKRNHQSQRVTQTEVGIRHTNVSRGIKAHITVLFVKVINENEDIISGSALLV